jgi:hypothetical protein
LFYDGGEPDSQRYTCEELLERLDDIRLASLGAA